MSRFYKGQFVIYDNTQGYVNFISEQYITICIKEYAKPPEEAEFARSTVRQVCICVPPERWDYVLETQQEVSNKFSTENAEIVENIK
ncbi:hypothetical protein SWYG_00054 [Synechococcus phage S-IOM18]|uniref:Uncharacterized protein n=1 Tax=Synechococcus phage S-IOM18 TaxID=754039 RepID=R9TLU9_9CAUD|nr:hypothetical protein SWYG_00054 [Synechococcus phage S-IOM18]AGN33566.1 hypothetical protein SWYG_00054 [Synechococcus phage S-IOM18]